MALTESKPITIEMKCGCGALLYVECHPGLSVDFTALMDLAKAWNAAHKGPPPVSSQRRGSR